MTTHAQEVLDRALRLEKWSRDEVERFLLLEKLGRVDVLKDADGNIALKSALFCQELQQSRPGPGHIDMMSRYFEPEASANFWPARWQPSWAHSFTCLKLELDFEAADV